MPYTAEQIGRMEFHVSRQARDRYQFDASMFSSRGHVIFANFHAARLFAEKINEQRDLLRFPEQAITAGQINALGLLDEILHLIIDQYCTQQNPQVMQQALQSLDTALGRDAVDRTLSAFANTFPPVAVYRNEIDLQTYLAGSTDGLPNREILLEEVLMLWLATMNPACSPFTELFDAGQLEQQTAYSSVIDGLHTFFESQPGFGPSNSESLIAVLRRPAIMHPDSLTKQLQFLAEQYGVVLGEYLFRLLSSLDLIKEEERMFTIGAGGPGPVEVYDFTGQEHEQERFTPDRDWMPRLVLIAKNAYVWLDQLSRKYQQPLTTLDQVPDAELDQLARWGVTGLWLIGLWERSDASKRIKQLMGNADAVASAYSLHSYQIANDLGGESAIQGLRARAWQRGIRLASDMVPNHMGIDSNWVMEHPDWFISLDYPPFPSYSFNGPDLSPDERVGIFLEDHYYTKTDASVVFKRVDRWSGHTQYIYHGNDGTSMPWNDTAQLNYLKPEVREAVIQTILDVARQFPIIRFDAAMTLAKKHYQRLWFPEPGTGGDIASRADHALTKAQFDALMPQEFWREVVDRAAVEAPDTLLLAEAFWMMEGYFVRTLGMHRVYNSAFMNILRDEENAKYRTIMKNTLEFDPEILKRFVNFMNNPDERTAVEQFGKGDKYFGICTLMVTMPGLPMLGHGQIEGFAEKYGMEYRRAYWDEQPDSYLIHRHEREIFPLMHRRYLFAEVEHFRLYDFVTTDGYVNEDVFAYSNRAGNERSLVVYYNKYGTVKGWIKTSATFAVKHASGDRTLHQQNLGDGLGLQTDDNMFTIFRDQITGLEYIRGNRELHDQGLYAELEAYKYQVFVDFREVRDNEWQQYRNLATYLNGRGVPSIEEAGREIILRPVLDPFRELVNADVFRRLIEAPAPEEDAQLDAALFSEVQEKTLRFLQGVKQFTNGAGDETGLADELQRELETMLRLPVPSLLDVEPANASTVPATAHHKDQDGDLASWGVLLAWVFTHKLGQICGDTDVAARSRSWVEEWRLDRMIASSLQSLGLDGAPAWRGALGTKVLISHERWFDIPASEQVRADTVLETLLKDTDVQQLLQVNRHNNILWYNKEAFDRLLWWLQVMTTVSQEDAVEQPQEPATDVDPQQADRQPARSTAEQMELLRQLQIAGRGSDYQIEKLLANAKDGATASTEKTSTR